MDAATLDRASLRDDLNLMMLGLVDTTPELAIASDLANATRLPRAAPGPVVWATNS